MTAPRALISMEGEENTISYLIKEKMKKALVMSHYTVKSPEAHKERPPNLVDSRNQTVTDDRYAPSADSPCFRLAFSHMGEEDPFIYQRVPVVLLSQDEFPGRQNYDKYHQDLQFRHQVNQHIQYLINDMIPEPLANKVNLISLILSNDIKKTTIDEAVSQCWSQRRSGFITSIVNVWGHSTVTETKQQYRSLQHTAELDTTEVAASDWPQILARQIFRTILEDSVFSVLENRLGGDIASQIAVEVASIAIRLDRLEIRSPMQTTSIDVEGAQFELLSSALDVTP
ncbi:hypothetical protein PROFUN_12998 [Planoprotostelium fungivorum]|uniref:Uncharacterized protein n=1 Tax=Planoprotostelium fungivorum TaxID=1890364 RepID=A0A2P6N624_9EUKA|nr:hypothetical protein PROFUN_12998 [Planoprotostelium fungivorum]